MNSTLAPKRGTKERDDVVILRKSTQLQGRIHSEKVRTRNPHGGQKKSARRDKMSLDAQSCSDETKTDDQGIAAGMMKLAIVCAHVQKAAASEVPMAASNLPSRNVGLFLARLQ